MTDISVRTLVNSREDVNLMNSLRSEFFTGQRCQLYSDIKMMEHIIKMHPDMPDNLLKELETSVCSMWEELRRIEQARLSLRGQYGRYIRKEAEE